MEAFVLELAKSAGVTHVPAWAMLVVASLNVALIIILALIARRFVTRILGAAQQRWCSRVSDQESSKRIETLARIISYVFSVVITLVALMLVLSELGVSIAPLLATAGVVGVAISFGAQSLVKDYFTGFVMLLENQIRQGDFIEVAGKSGSVEEVTLRYVRLRDGEGAVHFVPNGAIAAVTNHSREFAYAVIEVGVGYKANLGQTYEVIKAVGQSVRDNPDYANGILDDIEVLGVNQLGESSVGIRLRMKVRASDKWGIRRALLGALKEAFDEAGIEIPFPQRVVHMPQSTQ